MHKNAFSSRDEHTLLNPSPHLSTVKVFTQVRLRHSWPIPYRPLCPSAVLYTALTAYYPAFTTPFTLYSSCTTPYPPRDPL